MTDEELERIIEMIEEELRKRIMNRINKYKILIIGIISILVYIFICNLFIFASDSGQQSQWTISTLKEHYDYVLKERDEKINQKFTSLELAVLKAEQATEKRFESVNEFRAQLTDQSRTFIARTEYEAGYIELTKQVEDLKTRIDKADNLKTGGGQIWAYVVSGVSLLFAFVMLVMRFIGK